MKNQTQPCRSFAMSLLSVKDYTSDKLRGRLMRKNYSPEDIEDTLEWVKESGYIDEVELMKRQIDIYASRNYGKIIIKQKLRDHLFATEILQEHFDEFCNQVDFEGYCTAEVEKRVNKVDFSSLDKAEARKEKDKIIRQVMSRGYSIEIIKKVVGGYFGQ